jgi:hypothetical protein
MAKVFPVQDMHVGGPNGGVWLRAAIGWREDDPFVREHQDLFFPPEYDEKQAELEKLREELAATKALLTAEAAKSAPKKATG